MNEKTVRSNLFAAIVFAFTPMLAFGQGQFQIEEASIANIQNSIKSGQTTCRAVVQAYIDRAHAYNGTCTALVTADGAPIPAVDGRSPRGFTYHVSNNDSARLEYFPDFTGLYRAAIRTWAGWSRRFRIPVFSNRSECAWAFPMRVS